MERESNDGIDHIVGNDVKRDIIGYARDEPVLVSISHQHRDRRETARE